MTAIVSTSSDIIYPDSDGKPMSDNTKQFRWIVMIKENLELLFADRSDVFVAGDLLWYPVEGNNKLSQAPDAMVAIGRPKGDRGSYRQWKEADIAPQVVFEILSPGNRPAEMKRKLKFYERYGVQEYYLYDPDNITLEGWIRNHTTLVVIDDMTHWVSPLLQIRFVLGTDDLEIYRPDGRKFLTTLELDERAEQEKQRAEQEKQRAEQEKQRAEQEKQRAEQEKQRAEHEKQRAEHEKQRAEHEKQRAEQEKQRADLAEVQASTAEERAETAEERAKRAEELLAQYRDRFGNLG